MLQEMKQRQSSLLVRLAFMLASYRIGSVNAQTSLATIRINVNGPAYTDSLNRVWEADATNMYFSGGVGFSSCPRMISNTEDDPLYCTYRYWTSVPTLPATNYAIAVPTGTYQVSLYFAETYFNAAGQRVFDVFLENSLVRSNYDIFAVTGGKDIATNLTYTVAVTEEMLNLAFQNRVNNPFVNAIEVVPAVAGSTKSPSPPTIAPQVAIPSTVRINVAGGQFVDPVTQNVWMADTYNVGNLGTNFNSCASDVLNTTLKSVFCSNRWYNGNFRYEIPVPFNGLWEIRLLFAELYFTAPDKRKFHVHVEGSLAISNLDVFDAAGSVPRSALVIPITKTISDGFASIEFVKVVNNPIINGFEIVPASGPANPPVRVPTLTPTKATVRTPTKAPTKVPSKAPTREPSKMPTKLPVPVSQMSTNGVWKLYNFPGVATRHENCFVMIGRKAYLIGGRETQDVDIFDPVSRTWSKGTRAPRLLHHMQCVYINNEIYFPAAWTDWYPQEKNTAVMYIYNTISNTWRNVTAMPEYRRRGSAAVVVDGTKIWVSHGNRGGHEQSTTNLATSYGWIDYYDTADGKWYLGDVMGFPDAPNPRDHTGGALVNGRICVAAGRNGGVDQWPIVKETDCFDPITKKWNDPPPPDHPDPRGGSAYGTSCDGHMIVAGGERSISSRVDVFNGTHWKKFQNGLIDSRHATGLAVDCVCNQIYIAAGSAWDGGVPINTTEIYFPGGTEVACLA